MGELTVRERGIRPSSFIVSSARVSGDLGSTVVVEVSTIADPAPKVTWQESVQGGDFKPIDNSSGRMETNLVQIDERYNYSLTIHNLSLSDNLAKYQLKLRNKLGTVNSPKFTILVNHLLCQTNKLRQEKTFNIQEPVQIACPLSVSAHPSTAVRWIYNSSTRYVHLGTLIVLIYHTTSFYISNLSDPNPPSVWINRFKLLQSCDFYTRLLIESRSNLSLSSPSSFKCKMIAL